MYLKTVLFQFIQIVVSYISSYDKLVLLTKEFLIIDFFLSQIDGLVRKP